MDRNQSRWVYRMRPANTKCPVCQAKLEPKIQQIVNIDYPVTFRRNSKMVTVTGLRLHLECRLSDDGHKFLGEVRGEETIPQSPAR